MYSIPGGSRDVQDLLERTISLEKLRRRIARLETGGKRHGGNPVSSGCEALDALLPERGFCRGTLVEWLSAEGAGACTLALLAARHACSDGGMLAIFDHRREFFPPAAVRLGIEPQQLLVVRADTAADNHWAIDQALRSQAVAAVLAWPGRLDDRTFRRWQLAAEEGGCLAMLLRPETARGEPSWADVRLSLESLPFAAMARGTEEVAGNTRSIFRNFSRQPPPSPSVAPPPRERSFALSRNRKRLLQIVLLRCRGENAGRGVDVELDDETYRVHSLEQRRWQVAT
jgi:protein ImuA